MQKSIVFDKTLLCGAFLFLLFSQINTIDYLPWYKFISNFCIFISILLLSLVLIYKKEKIIVPRWSLLFILISFIPFFQYLVGVNYFFSTVFLSFSYIYIFIIVSIVFFNFFKYHEKTTLKYSGLSLFIITFFHIFSSYIQWLNIDLSSLFFLENKTNRVFGNLGQPNNLASFLLISLVVLMYWFENKKIGIKLFYFNSLNIVFCLILTQSRTGALGFLVIMLFLALFRAKFYLVNLKIITILTTFFILFNLLIIKLQDFIAGWIGLEFLGGGRVLEKSIAQDTRFEIWNFFIKVISEKPWFGYGWYQTQTSQYYNFTDLNGRFVSAHNIFLDIFIWNGVIIGSLIIFAVAFLLILILIKIKDNKDYLFFLVFFILLNHSLFEFPLFYPYFIFIFSIFLAYFFNKIDFKYVSISRYVYALVLSIQTFFMYVVWSDYIEYQDKKFFASNSGMGFVEPYSVNIKILDVLEQDLVLLSINKFDRLSEKEITEIEKLVSHNISFYNLLKFCQLLYNNGYYTKVDETIHKLKILYNYEVDKKQLMSLQF